MIVLTQPETDIAAMTSTTPVATASRSPGTPLSRFEALRQPEFQVLGAVSVAHLISHFHILVLPVLFPFFKEKFGVGYVELGLALTLFNVVSGLTQAPMGFLVDRIGARRVLMGGLLVGACAFASLGLVMTYSWLLVTALVAGLANCVYHPADYSILNARMSEGRMGRAFSIHTFAGYLGGAITPAVMLFLVYGAGLRTALVVAGLVAVAAAGLLLMVPSGAETAPAAGIGTTGGKKGGAAAGAQISIAQVMTPAILMLMIFFTFLALSNGGIQNFGVPAWTAQHANAGFGIGLTAANVALTAFLFTSAAGVLAGGYIADRTTRHGEAAALAFGMTAVLIFLVGAYRIEGTALAVVMAIAGFLSGTIAPSRDMLVRKAAPAGAAGRVFGIVSTGFNIGGIIAPIIYGWILDNRAPPWVFYVSSAFMAATVVLVLFTDWRARSAAAQRAVKRAAPAPSTA
jgi:MFS transporter, FSR family, fosmidomycin resistance protein